MELYNLGLVAALSAAILICCSIAFADTADVSDDASAATVLAQAQTHYASIERLKSSFRQVTYNATMGKEMIASGVYYAEKPGKVRWDYEKPDVQHLVINSGRVLFYVPADKQLVYSDAGQVEELKAVLDLLGGKGSLLTRFKARLLDEKEAATKGCKVVRIVPREPMGSLLRVDLSIDDETHLVKETAYWDIYGNRTKIYFSDITMPKSFDDTLFKLNVPRDVVVVDAAGNPIGSGMPSGEPPASKNEQKDSIKDDAN
ncbi:MAG: outer membrane lipoprotein carrier protein LolA [Candidatus Coatesbacteria bacterium]|nr:outer membrane lipoprotein carrier protein LolA [Candidatus Coatesbacteria bacterium]